MQKVTGSYKDYGRDNVLWSKIFFNYTIILIELFGTTTPFLHLAFYCFYCKIIDLFTVYKWQKRVFSLALDLHTHIVQSYPIDPLR